jgi:hypothetical protein
MQFLHEHLLFFGVVADSLTFLGGLILSWDAFVRLRDLRDKRIDDEFRRTFPKLNMTDKDWKSALWSVGRALAGSGLLAVGFLFQILMRFAEHASPAIS